MNCFELVGASYLRTLCLFCGSDAVGAVEVAIRIHMVHLVGGPLENFVIVLR